MLHASALWMTALAMIALAVTASPALSADLAAKKRCTDLVAFYDRWGTTRTEHNEGARNTRRIAAAIDCERGDYAAGIAELDDVAALGARRDLAHRLPERFDEPVVVHAVHAISMHIAINSKLGRMLCLALANMDDFRRVTTCGSSVSVDVDSGSGSDSWH